MNTSGAVQCPFPIWCILDDAKNLFESVLPTEIHAEAIDEGLGRGLKLHVGWTPVSDVAFLDGENNIHIHANFCQFLWMLNYISLVVCDCGQIMNGLVADKDISLSQARDMFDEAMIMLQMAQNMLKSRNNNPYEMLTQRGELYGVANPFNKPNKYTYLATSLTISGIAYLLQHEYGHFVKGHEDSTPLTETEADEHGFEKLLEWGKGQPYENVALSGPMMALSVTAFINPTFVGMSHPDIDNRMESLFKTYKRITKRSIPDGIFQLLVSVFSLWSYSFNSDIPPIGESENTYDYICRIRHEVIMPIKRQYKII